jgi:pheromone a factor receptor
VSNRHARVHCLEFECDGAPPLPPLVYVTDLSSNGTFLTNCGRLEDVSEQRVDHKASPLLLRDGDILRLGGNTLCLLIFEIEPTNVPRLTKQQIQESKACQY